MAYTPSMSDAAVEKATGRNWAAWFKRLDAAGAADMSHKEIALHLSNAESMSGWWAQSVTVEYERARGRRAIGQVANRTYDVSAQRTVQADLAKLKTMWLDGRQRTKWVLNPEWRTAITGAMRSRKETVTAMGDCVYLQLPVGSKARADRVQLTFSAKDPSRSVVRVQHQGIATAKERDQLKQQWGDLLDALRLRVESR